MLYFACGSRGFGADGNRDIANRLDGIRAVVSRDICCFTGVVELFGPYKKTGQPGEPDCRMSVNPAGSIFLDRPDFFFLIETKDGVVKKILFLFLFLSFIGGNDFAEGIPINSDVGLTPHKGEFIFRVQSRYLRKSDDPLNSGRSVDEVVVPFVGVYGFTAKSSVLFKVPVIYRDLKTASGAVRSDYGPGDVSIIGKHRFFTHNFKGGTSRISAILGLELPTGDDDARDSLGLLPKGIQLGSGSVDFIAGGTYTLQTLDHQFDMDLRYIFNNEANGFEFGDVFKYNLAYQKRIWPSILPDKGIYSQWNAVLELNGIFESKSELGGNDVANSGGNTVFLSPGIQFVSKRSVYELSFLYPVIQNLNGSQIETDYSVALSYRYLF